MPSLDLYLNKSGRQAKALSRASPPHLETHYNQLYFPTTTTTTTTTTTHCTTAITVYHRHHIVPPSSYCATTIALCHHHHIVPPPLPRHPYDLTMVSLLSNILRGRRFQKPKPPMSRPLPAFLLLPTELRLEIYKFLVESKTHTLKDPEEAHGVLTVYYKTCDMAILRTCETIRAEAEPAILSALRPQLDQPAFHFLTSPLAPVNRRTQVSRIVEHYIKIIYVRRGLLDHIDNPTLRRLSIRMQRLTDSRSLQLDYIEHPGNTSPDLQQDIAFLQVASEQAGHAVNGLVISRPEGRLVPIEEYLLNEPEQIDSSEASKLNAERRQWKEKFAAWNCLWNDGVAMRLLLLILQARFDHDEPIRIRLTMTVLWQAGAFSGYTIVCTFIASLVGLAITLSFFTSTSSTYRTSWIHVLMSLFTFMHAFLFTWIVQSVWKYRRDTRR
ncbi:hypothetical protein K504DRAFT_212889 [Pleomassaria siparia CBS 279.74]|uniref:Uncharacterized protein n=1 Tax=Pleomassaria siparia CBS 279.74 TaxID=1314801 RepID=A0A6G1JRF6_9PLEO|nr:hypothetical protein K504DRAFT_212889 [Pleomassaria siparia CBS 279.74]